MPDFKNYNARKDGAYDKIWREVAKKCVFCDLKDKYIVARKKHVVLTVNIFPYIDGHLLIIPLRHVEGLLDFNKVEWQEVSELVTTGIKVLRNELKIKDIWCLFRDAKEFGGEKTVTHAHWHLFPYYVGMYKREEERDITVPPIEMATKLRKII